MRPDKSREGLYLALLAAALTAGLAAVAWYEIRHNTGDGVLETVLAVFKHMQGVIVFAAATIYIAVEGGYMLAERYLRRRYREGREDGREEGLEEGRQEGRKEVAAAWSAWHQRMLDAQSRGEPFDEPPPKMEDTPG